MQNSLDSIVSHVSGKFSSLERILRRCIGGRERLHQRRLQPHTQRPGLGRQRPGRLRSVPRRGPLPVSGTHTAQQLPHLSMETLHGLVELGARPTPSTRSNFWNRFMFLYRTVRRRSGQSAVHVTTPPRRRQLRALAAPRRAAVGRRRRHRRRHEAPRRRAARRPALLDGAVPSRWQVTEFSPSFIFVLSAYRAQFDKSTGATSRWVVTPLKGGHDSGS